MAQIKCSRCQHKKEGLQEAPFNNELGQKVLVKTCDNCCKAWVGQQLMLMNEHRLDPIKDEPEKVLDEEMVKFIVWN